MSLKVYILPYSTCRSTTDPPPGADNPQYDRQCVLYDLTILYIDNHSYPIECLRAILRQGYVEEQYSL